MLLSVQQRSEVDDRTLGDLFLAMVDELADISFAHSFDLIMAAMFECVRELFGASEEQITRLSDAMISKLPAYMQVCLQKYAISCA